MFNCFNMLYVLFVLLSVLVLFIYVKSVLKALQSFCFNMCFYTIDITHICYMPSTFKINITRLDLMYQKAKSCLKTVNDNNMPFLEALQGFVRVKTCPQCYFHYF